MSMNFAPNAVRASRAPPIVRNERRERLPALSLMRAPFRTPILQKFATLLFQLIGLPIELHKHLHRFSTLFRLTEPPIDGSKHVEVGRGARIDGDGAVQRFGGGVQVSLTFVGLCHLKQGAI